MSHIPNKTEQAKLEAEGEELRQRMLIGVPGYDEKGRLLPKAQREKVAAESLEPPRKSSPPKVTTTRARKR